MTSRLLPAAATAAVCVALTGLALRTLAPQQRAPAVRPAAAQTGSSAAVQAPAALLIRIATRQAQQLLGCPAIPGSDVSQSATTAGPATSTSPTGHAASGVSRSPLALPPAGPARGTCGRLTVLLAETGPDTGGLSIVLLIGVLQPDPVRGGTAIAPIPMALRCQVSRTPAGALIAQVVGP